MEVSDQVSESEQNFMAMNFQPEEPSLSLPKLTQYESTVRSGITSMSQGISNYRMENESRNIQEEAR